MTDLTEARKALEAVVKECTTDTEHVDVLCVADAVLDMMPHLPTILQCLQAAEQAQAVGEQGALPKVSAW